MHSRLTRSCGKLRVRKLGGLKTGELPGGLWGTDRMAIKIERRGSYGGCISAETEGVALRIPLHALGAGVLEMEFALPAQHGHSSYRIAVDKGSFEAFALLMIQADRNAAIRAFASALSLPPDCDQEIPAR
jgi:hypothetical protein